MATQPGNAPDKVVRDRIIRTLHRYPNISVSMLGPHVRPYRKDWRVVLEALIKEGIVVRENKATNNIRYAFVHRLAVPVIFEQAEASSAA